MTQDEFLNVLRHWIGQLDENSAERRAEIYRQVEELIAQRFQASGDEHALRAWVDNKRNLADAISEIEDEYRTPDQALDQKLTVAWSRVRVYGVLCVAMIGILDFVKPIFESTLPIFIVSTLCFFLALWAARALHAYRREALRAAVFTGLLCVVSGLWLSFRYFIPTADANGVIVATFPQLKDLQDEIRGLREPVERVAANTKATVEGVQRVEEATRDLGAPRLAREALLRRGYAADAANVQRALANDDDEALEHLGTLGFRPTADQAIGWHVADMARATPTEVIAYALKSDLVNDADYKGYLSRENQSLQQLIDLRRQITGKFDEIVRFCTAIAALPRGGLGSHARKFWSETADCTASAKDGRFWAKAKTFFSTLHSTVYEETTAANRDYIFSLQTSDDQSDQAALAAMLDGLARGQLAVDTSRAARQQRDLPMLANGSRAGLFEGELGFVTGEGGMLSANAVAGKNEYVWFWLLKPDSEPAARECERSGKRCRGKLYAIIPPGATIGYAARFTRTR